MVVWRRWPPSRQPSSASGAAAAGRIGEVVGVQVIPGGRTKIFGGAFLPLAGKVNNRRERWLVLFQTSPFKVSVMSSNNNRNGTNHEALGLVETKGLIATIAATDAMCKAANITLAGQVQIGGAYVTTLVRGDVGSVRAAVDAGSEPRPRSMANWSPAHVIPRPEEAVLDTFLGR